VPLTALTDLGAHGASFDDLLPGDGTLADETASTDGMTSTKLSGRRAGRRGQAAVHRYGLVRNISTWLPSMKGVVKGMALALLRVRRRWPVSTSFVRWGAPR
jgi:hypothetical protein